MHPARKPPMSKEVIDHYRNLQSTLASQVVERPLTDQPEHIAAVDVHFAGERGIAAAVLVSYPELNETERRIAVLPNGSAESHEPAENVVDITRETVDSPNRSLFPYVPGLLAFREAPVCLAAIEQLQVRPDLVLVDGHGRAHPRRFGIGCHLGHELRIPTIGIAKSILVGQHDEVGNQRGCKAPLVDRGETIGMAVRTRPGTKPIFVSVGDLITLDDAVEWTLLTTGRYRLPEPSRIAHHLARSVAEELRAD